MLTMAMPTSDGLTRRHAPSWTPTCPECGYAIRALPRSTCPECGVGFPTQCPYFRRWGVLRLAWDRINPGSLLVAYVRTVAMIVARPWRATLGLVVPDRWGRCWGWGSAHICLSALATALLANGKSLHGWMMFRLLPEEFRLPHRATLGDIPLGQVLVWLSQSAVVWAFVFSVPVIVGIVLALCIPTRHRAAKFGGLKWSLYLTALFLPIIAVWYGYYNCNPPLVYVTGPVEFSSPGAAPDLPIGLLGAGYGLWWATGIAANPYNRERGIRPFLKLCVLYGAAWTLVTQILFPLGMMHVLL